MKRDRQQKPRILLAQRAQERFTRQNQMAKHLGKSLFGDELLVSVFAQFEPRSTFRIRDESEVVTAFFALRDDPKFKDLFANYPFDTDGLEPSSRVLSEAIDALQQARLLGRMNPDLINYTISPGMKIRYEKFIKPKVADEEQQQRIREMADEIRTRLNIAEPIQVSANAPGQN